MKALGRGSIASVIKTGLSLAGVVMWIGLAIVGMVAALALLAGLAAALSGPFRVDGDLAVTVSGVTLRGDHPEVLPWPFAAAVLLAAAVGLGGALAIVHRLKRLFENFTSNEPFNRANADHLRAIWIIMLAMEVARYGFAAAVGWSAAIYGRPQGLEPLMIEPGFDLSTWTSILVLIVLAEVFREGARLREDQDLTI
ncbi:MAG: DUF2975 domain-containing protein [Alphaproteobacteria bacterium]|jgi:hypothetical protein|nr:DUF2975 domain-containing protein [Alphaproteobacteria bacterium]